MELSDLAERTYARLLVRPHVGGTANCALVADIHSSFSTLYMGHNKRKLRKAVPSGQTTSFAMVTTSAFDRPANSFGSSMMPRTRKPARAPRR
jgi:hypothetical protein